MRILLILLALLCLYLGHVLIMDDHVGEGLFVWVLGPLFFGLLLLESKYVE